MENSLKTFPASLPMEGKVEVVLVSKGMDALPCAAWRLVHSVWMSSRQEQLVHTPSPFPLLPVGLARLTCSFQTPLSSALTCPPLHASLQDGKKAPKRSLLKQLM